MSHLSAFALFKERGASTTPGRELPVRGKGSLWIGLLVLCGYDKEQSLSGE